AAPRSARFTPPAPWGPPTASVWPVTPSGGAMPKGGARTRSGPPPDPNALRRARDASEWTVLPAAGRQGPPPEWPLPTSSRRERDVWAELWTRPQAVVWERQRQHHEVALYVRRLVEAEARGAVVALST